MSDESTSFTRDKRDTNSVFAGLTQSFEGQRLEASARRDDDDQFGSRNTGSVSDGMEYPEVVRLSATYARGFRAPTFFDLYASAPGYTPNPNLQPERSKSYEYTVKSDAKAPLQWRITAFDNRFENLIVFTFTPTSSTVVNAARARARGVEASLDAAWLGTRWPASVTVQRPRAEATGKTLQEPAQHSGSLDAPPPLPPSPPPL